MFQDIWNAIVFLLMQLTDSQLATADLSDVRERVTGDTIQLCLLSYCESEVRSRYKQKEAAHAQIPKETDGRMNVIKSQLWADKDNRLPEMALIQI